MSLFRDDDDRKTGPQRVFLTEKPATSDDAEGPSIAEQINFGGDYDKEYMKLPLRKRRKRKHQLYKKMQLNKERNKKSFQFAMLINLHINAFLKTQE